MTGDSDDDIAAALAWLDQFQAIRPAGVSLEDPAGAALSAARAARDQAADLPLDSDFAGFTALLQSYARDA